MLVRGPAPTTRANCPQTCSKAEPAYRPSIRPCACCTPRVLCTITRLWLASYQMHVRKVHWRTGADWMWAHLLDGDLASNHLSWQWVTGTASARPYLFNAENVTRFAPAHWHSPATAIDAHYGALEHLDRTPAAIAGREIWLMHPWALACPPKVSGKPAASGLCGEGM